MTDQSRYKDQDKDALIKKIEELESLIDELKKEREVGDMLNFGWAGNLGRWLWHIDSNTVIYNPLKATTLGYSKDELPQNVGYQFFTEKLHPDDYENTMEAMRKHLKGEKSVYETEYRIKTKTGGWKWFYDIGKITRYDESGKPLVLVGIVFDITERKEAEENLRVYANELQKSNIVKNKLFSIIAHDLRNPFNTILGYTDVLADMLKEESYEEMGGIIATLNQAALREYQLLQNLLMWSKSQMEGFNIVPAKIDIKQIADGEIELLSSAAAKKNITIINELGNDTNAIADENMTGIIIRNLVSNAVKFSNESGSIRIKSTLNGDFITISVIDNGVGMSEESMKKLFHSEINDTTAGTQNEKGSGLGLMLCKELVTQNGGTIWAEKNPTGGSIFSFTLPVTSKK